MIIRSVYQNGGSTVFLFKIYQQAKKINKTLAKNAILLYNSKDNTFFGGKA